MIIPKTTLVKQSRWSKAVFIILCGSGGHSDTLKSQVGQQPTGDYPGVKNSMTPLGLQAFPAASRSELMKPSGWRVKPDNFKNLKQVQHFLGDNKFLSYLKGKNMFRLVTQANARALTTSWIKWQHKCLMTFVYEKLLR